MRRRAALCALAAIVAAPRLRAQPAGKVHRVGFVATTSPLAEISGPDPANPFTRAFVHGLRDLGYVQGKNLVLEMRTLESKPERLEGFIVEFVRLEVDVVFLPATPLVRRAHKVAPKMPIVALVSGSDLMGSSLAQSLARPGGMVTGLTIDVD
jgi:putative ABC transport system substrate-binding protein